MRSLLNSGVKGQWLWKESSSGRLLKIKKLYLVLLFSLTPGKRGIIFSHSISCSFTWKRQESISVCHIDHIPQHHWQSSLSGLHTMHLRWNQQIEKEMSSLVHWNLGYLSWKSSPTPPTWLPDSTLLKQLIGNLIYEFKKRFWTK